MIVRVRGTVVAVQGVFVPLAGKAAFVELSAKKRGGTTADRITFMPPERRKLIWPGRNVIHDARFADAVSCLTSKKPKQIGWDSAINKICQGTGFDSGQSAVTLIRVLILGFCQCKRITEKVRVMGSDDACRTAFPLFCKL